ncbi:MAG: hypothetical protein DRQ49_13345 [Gammaproteobacteria bacterium]|nr:MAG: hypothetical protein DRQ49_13345 [Gammaproteobacteria bacterium]
MNISVKIYLILIILMILTIGLSFEKQNALADNASKMESSSLYHLPTQVLHTLFGHQRNVTSIAFSPNGDILASGSEDETIKLWRVSTGKLLKTFKAHNFWVTSLAFSPSGKILASGGEDKTIKLWDMETGKALRSLQGHENSVTSVAFNSSGSILASASWDRKFIYGE